MSETSPLDWLRIALEQWDEQHLRRRLRVRSGPQKPTLTYGEKTYVHFGANDYLNLASDPRIAQAVCTAVNQHGWGSGASPLISGHTEQHQALAHALARFEQAEAALLFTSGFAANAGTIPALVGPDDFIFADQKNHASLIDGCRLSGASISIYRHGDVDHLESLLQQSTHRGKRLIVTDSLFSMDGDFAPLQQIAPLRERFDCMLLIDEAHATGVFGDSGRGVAERMGVESSIDIKIGTLSKALAGCGGFVCGEQRLMDWLANRARSYVFSTSPPAAAVAAAETALDIVSQEPERRTLLLERAGVLREAVRELGFDIGETTSQIIPLRVGSADRAMLFAEQLLEAGFFVPAIRPPSVPEGECLLRISLSYGHNESTISNLIDALSQLALKSAV
ncbi:MAG: 8-amino-7-oxononanoate synthase [Planctomycetota bacterium]|nr:8-amino-7-oxononanoate synthase [Planctomycetota bacterium]MEC8337105.1 8-amino-7-oxononanoate synthase [Planctomycetota bacterium]